MNARASDPVSFGQKLNGIEGKFTEHYFKQVLGLFARAVGINTYTAGSLDIF